MEKFLQKSSLDHLNSFGFWRLQRCRNAETTGRLTFNQELVSINQLEQWVPGVFSNLRTKHRPYYVTRLKALLLLVAEFSNRERVRLKIVRLGSYQSMVSHIAVITNSGFNLKERWLSNDKALELWLQTHVTLCFQLETFNLTPTHFYFSCCWDQVIQVKVKN